MKKTLGIISFIFVWQLAAMCAAKKIFPAPTDVFFSLLNNSRQLAMHSVYSIYRLVAGVMSAIIVGLPLGLLLGYFKKADRFFSPVLYILAPIPKIALLPLIMLFFGIGNVSKIFIIFIIMVFQVIVAVRDCVNKIPEPYFMSCRAARANAPFIFLNIVFPAALPDLFTSVRVGLATSISVLFFAESFGTRWGLGFYVMDMWMRLDYRQMYLGILALGTIGLLSVVLVDKLEKRVCPWADFNEGS